MFVRWLHNKLMERCALSKKSVYADHILAPYLALEDVPFAEREVVGPLQRAIEADLYPGLPSGIYGQTITSLPVRKPKKSEVPDLRAAMMRPDGSFPPSGIRREDWEVLFQSAVRSSQVAVLVLNDQYTNSDYCQAEVRMIRDENELRVQEDRSPLRVVALRVNKGVSNDATNMNVIDQMIRSAMDNPTVLSVTPEMPSADTPNARQINWTISDGDLDRIVQAIGNLSAT